MKLDLAKRIALVAAVVALCAGAFFSCFERREVEVERGTSREARENRYLALGRLLQHMGHEVVMLGDLSRLAELPEPPATVFVLMDRSAFGARRSDALLHWVSRGGHLVVATYTVWGPPEEPVAGGPGDVILSGPPDLLLDRFGLHQRYEKPSAAKQEATEADPEDPAPEEEAKPAREAPTPEESLREMITGVARESLETSYAYLDEDADALELEFQPQFWWDDTQHRAVWSVEGEKGAHLLEVEHGAGRITALTSDEPFLNDWIGESDHAEFAVRWLRDGRSAPAPVWIFYAEDWPSWFALLRRNAAPALWGGAALLALWLWRSLVRFGPILPAPDPARRRWLEHLEAAGHFHWRQDRGRTLLGDLRAELGRELARKRPAWARLPEQERLLRCAQASGLSTEQAAHALLGEPRAPKAFAAAVRALERIRAAL